MKKNYKRIFEIIEMKTNKARQLMMDVRTTNSLWTLCMISKAFLKTKTVITA